MKRYSQMEDTTARESVHKRLKMILFGHRFIKSEKIYHIFDIDGISNTPPSSIIYLEFNEKNLDIIEHLQLNEITYALKVEDITQIIYAQAFDASYIIVHKELARTAQEIATTYLFDAKILAIIEDEEEIEELALLGVDGVLFSNAVIKVLAP